MMFGPTPFPREPVRAIVINPNRQSGAGFVVGALERFGRSANWTDPPTLCDDLDVARSLAQAMRRRTGLPLLDRHDAPPPAPTGGMAA